jgi:hypothetical protein
MPSAGAIRNSDFVLASMQTNEKPTDRHIKKKKKINAILD